MNAPTIKFQTPSGEYEILNRWELLSPKQYYYLCTLLHKYSASELSYRELHLAYICGAILELDPSKIKGITALENLYLLSSQIDFIFKTPKQMNACFLAQLVPEIEVSFGKRKKIYHAYKIQTGCDILTSTLTALQFIEAYELIGCSTDKLPLMAAILYHPGRYTSEGAHALSEEFKDIDKITLQAISLNFMAFVNYLFTQSPFKILHARKGEEIKPISIGMSESLYNLSADGLGDAEAIEQMPVIKYLTILRKKLIESVKAMKEVGLDLVELSEKTGLSIKIIQQIL